jgi:Mn-containing catalase
VKKVEMKFLVTRESIKAYDYAAELEELRKEEIEKCFTVALNDLCDDFVTNIRSNPKDTRFVWRKLQTPRYFSPYLRHGSMGQNVIERFVLSSDEHLPRFVKTLGELFIFKGCNIIVDPLKTYIIIGWL